jgi:hypothetical protein
MVRFGYKTVTSIIQNYDNIPINIKMFNKFCFNNPDTKYQVVDNMTDIEQTQSVQLMITRVKFDDNMRIENTEQINEYCFTMRSLPWNFEDLPKEYAYHIHQKQK